MNERARVVRKAVVNRTTCGDRDKAIGDGQLGREVHTAGAAWETAKMGKERRRTEEALGETGGLYK